MGMPKEKVPRDYGGSWRPLRRRADWTNKWGILFELPDEVEIAAGLGEDEPKDERPPS
jgi:hypothetical protein